MMTGNRWNKEALQSIEDGFSGKLERQHADTKAEITSLAVCKLNNNRKIKKIEQQHSTLSQKPCADIDSWQNPPIAAVSSS